MRRIIGILVAMVIMSAAYGQGVGFGYVFDIGGSAYKQPGSVYSQSIFSMTHNGFIRIHNRSGHNAIQLMVGYRYDSVAFRNRSEFLAPDGNSMMQYNTNAAIVRDALRFSVIDQMQLGRPGRLVISVNAGLFLESTLNAARHGLDDGFNYDLDDEIHYCNPGGILGIEFRLACFTLGYKYEQLFRDVLDHKYINRQELNLTNCSELRGLVLNPPMHYLCLGINLDFFNKNN